jgi:hypothetical protein
MATSPASPSGTRRVRAWLATRSLPWFAVGLVLTVGGVVVLDGTGEAAVVLAGFVVLFCACVRYTILSVRDDPLTSLLVSRRGLIGWMSAESRAGQGAQLAASPSMSRAAAPASRSMAASSAAPSARR